MANKIKRIGMSLAVAALAGLCTLTTGCFEWLSAAAYGSYESYGHYDTYDSSSWALPAGDNFWSTGNAMGNWDGDFGYVNVDGEIYYPGMF